MWLLLLLMGCTKLTKLSRKLFINNPDLKKLYTQNTLIVTPPEAIRRQGCGPVFDPDNLEAIRGYFAQVSASPPSGHRACVVPWWPSQFMLCPCVAGTCCGRPRCCDQE